MVFRDMLNETYFHSETARPNGSEERRYFGRDNTISIAGVLDVPDGSGRPRRTGKMDARGNAHFVYIIVPIEPKQLSDAEVMRRFENVGREQGITDPAKLRDYLDRKLPNIVIDEYGKAFGEILPEGGMFSHGRFRILKGILSIEMIGRWKIPEANPDEFFAITTKLSAASIELRDKYGMHVDKTLTDNSAKDALRS